jgi:hypothetical protein
MYVRVFERLSAALWSALLSAGMSSSEWRVFFLHGNLSHMTQIQYLSSRSSEKGLHFLSQ